MNKSDGLPKHPTALEGGRITKVFDPADGFAPLVDVHLLTDATLVRRADRWWMFPAGMAGETGCIRLFSASLPKGAPRAATGWRVEARSPDPSRIAVLAGDERSQGWDRGGGRHCPSYVRGQDPDRGTWMERLYYAGAAENRWGPYTVGYLEWDGHRWVDQPAPVFTAEEDWERDSVYEPNLIYADGKWKMWYVSGSNQEDYLVHGFAESADGRGDWSRHQIVFPAEEKVFDFCIIRGRQRYEAVFSRVWLAKTARPGWTGLWWSECERPSQVMSDWSEPVQIMTAGDRGWYSGPWKPSLRYDENDPNRMFVFFDGSYEKPDQPGFPFVFTLGCLELPRPPYS